MIKVANNTTKLGFRKVIYKNVMVAYKRYKNDIYGNPLYRVVPVNFSFRHNDKAYRNYENYNSECGPYYLLQSYNIETDIENLINNMLEKYNLSFPEFDKELVKNWRDVTTLNDQNLEVVG